MLSCRYIASFALCLATGSVLAQSGGPSETDWNISIGGAGIFSPDFPGSDDEDFMAVPFIDIEYKDRFFLNVPDGLGMNLLDSEAGSGVGYRLGVAIAPEFQDREQSDAPGLPEIEMTALATVFGSLSYRSFSLSATLARDLIDNGHEGSWAELELDWSTRLGRRGFISFGPFVRFADDNYMNSFYTVTPDVALEAGLPVFKASSGRESIGARAVGIWRLTRAWEVFAQLGVEQLSGDAEDSPISVDDQAVSAIVAVAYRF